MRWLIYLLLLVLLSCGDRAKKEISPVKSINGETYGLPPEIWQTCNYSYKGKKYLDMTSQTWIRLPWEKQRQYAADYRRHYAQIKGKAEELELTVAETRFYLSLVPPGRFWQGMPFVEKDREKDQYPHRVLMTRPYYIGKFEINQRQWRIVTGNSPSRFVEDPLLPVEKVSWYDSIEFCRKLSQLTRQNVQLPTEAQWEYACRAGVTKMFNLGANISTEQVNYHGFYPYLKKNRERTRNRTMVCGKLENNNSWGCLDFHGNVWEWCADWYGSYPTGQQLEPSGPGNGSFRVQRGGSWSSSAISCRSAQRYWARPGTKNDNTGLRIVVNLSEN